MSQVIRSPFEVYIWKYCALETMAPGKIILYRSTLISGSGRIKRDCGADIGADVTALSNYRYFSCSPKNPAKRFTVPQIAAGMTLLPLRHALLFPCVPCFGS